MYGTRGTDQESRALLARARFDQQLVWYREGHVPLALSDAEFVKNLRGGVNADLNPYVRSVLPDASVVLYGDAVTNSAWSFLDDEDRVALGDRAQLGDDIVGWFRRVKGELPVRKRRTRLDRNEQVLPDEPYSVSGFVATGLRAIRVGSMMLLTTRDDSSSEFSFYRLESGARPRLRPLLEGKFAPRGASTAK